MANKNKDKNKNKNKNKNKKGQDARTVANDISSARSTAEELGLLPTLDRLDTSGQETLTRTLKDLFDTAGQRSADMVEVQTLMKGGLAGLNATENQALREQAQRSMDTQYQTALRGLSMGQSRGGVRGAAATAQQGNLNKERMTQQNQMEQDLLVKNIDIQDKRRAAYSDLVAGMENQEFGRKAKAGEMLGTAQAELNKSDVFNVGQSNAQHSGDLSVITGLANMTQAERNKKREMELARAGLATSRANTNRAAQSQDAYSNAVAGLVDQRFGAGTSAGV